MTTQRPPVRALRHQLPDHASHSDARGIAIDKVGIKGLSWPITVWDRADGMQHTVADIEATVALPADVKGTHMSRFVEVLNNLNTGAAGSELSLKNLPDLLAAMQHRLGAERAQLDANFPYFLQRCAPVSGAKSLSSYRCGFHAEREAEEFRFELRVEVPVTTLCPCSKAVSERGAHNQRGYVRVRVRSTGMLWIEDVVEAVEAVASAPLYSLLKREDEKFVTEQAYDNPVFVEDLLRESVRVLQAHAAGVTWLRVEVENIESIHNHSAFASLTWAAEPPASSPSGAPLPASAEVPTFGCWLSLSLSLSLSLGISHSLLSKVEADERRLSEPTLELLARALGVNHTEVRLRSGLISAEMVARLLADPAAWS